MKFAKLRFFLPFLILLCGINLLKLKTKKFMTETEEKMNSDSILDRVRLLIREISNTRLKSDNLNAKKKFAGALPEGYPEQMIENAKKMRLNKRSWSSLMAFPTEVWRFCLFPLFKVNYKKHCQNQFSTGIEDEVNGKQYPYRFSLLLIILQCLLRPPSIRAGPHCRTRHHRRAFISKEPERVQQDTAIL